MQEIFLPEQERDSNMAIDVVVGEFGTRCTFEVARRKVGLR